jgi:hypothetical protein
MKTETTNKKIREIIYNAVVNEKFQYNDFELIVSELTALLSQTISDTRREVLLEFAKELEEYIPTFKKGAKLTKEERIAEICFYHFRTNIKSVLSKLQKIKGKE